MKKLTLKKRFANWLLNIAYRLGADKSKTQYLPPETPLHMIFETQSFRPQIFSAESTVAEVPLHVERWMRDGLEEALKKDIIIRLLKEIVTAPGFIENYVEVYSHVAMNDPLRRGVDKTHIVKIAVLPKQYIEELRQPWQ